MRILFLTDTHIRGTTPKNRKDNLPITLMGKLREVMGMIDEYDIDFLLHGGDLFDRPDISIAIVNEFASILNEIEIPIYIISGNHDIYGHNPTTINRSMLGLLGSLNIVNVIDQHDTIILDKGGIKVQLTGHPYIYNIDDEKNRNYYIIDDVPDDIDYAIHMVHGMLLNRPFIEGIPYTLIDDIKTTRADITLSGHYHSGFGIIDIGGKYFVNPGSLIRVTNSIAEINRMPQVALIELGESIDIRLMGLKTAHKGEEVLDRQEIENHTFKTEKLLEFRRVIGESGGFEKLEINEILMEISSMEGIEDRVKEEALRRIAISQGKNLGDEL
ncbi:MAG: metallophosphoesterase [Tissierellia bacterium]|nr:metallophosphoesterase [Tissierellia bacterium]